MIETLCILAPDLQPGDRLLSTGIGGYSGEVLSVRVYEDYVRADLIGNPETASLAPYEVCSVERVRLSPEAELRAQVTLPEIDAALERALP